MTLSVAVYKASRAFPPEERFGLTQQLRKAVVSVPSNIAEGRGRGTPRDYRQFLYNARGSLYEVETQLLLSKDLEYISIAGCEALVSAADEVIRIINGVIQYLEKTKGL